MNIYPWQSELWARLAAMRARLPHALLLQGAPGIGKLDFTLALAQSLLCSVPDAAGVACGQCEACNWFAQGNHPDFRLLEPALAEQGGEEGSPPGGRKSQIAVDQVRDAGDFITLSSHRAGLRVVLLHPADALNASSANALLKMLEEPPDGVLFLLVAHAPQRLLPTIRSRCSRIDMPVPTRAQAAAWLQAQAAEQAEERLAYAGGSPLRALELEASQLRALHEIHQRLAQADRMDAFSVAARLAAEGMAAALELVQKWVYDMLQVLLADQAPRYHPAWHQALQALVKQVDLVRLLDFQRTLTDARRLAQHPLNAELQLETLMIQYTQMFSGGARA